MRVKYILGLAFLLTGNVAMTQELDSVIYERTHVYTYFGKKKQKQSKEALMGDRKARLIYSPACLLFNSPQGADTVFLSNINKTSNYFLYGGGRMFYISYNNRSDFISLLFRHKKEAENFKKFMMENGGRYKTNVLGRPLPAFYFKSTTNY